MSVSLYHFSHRHLLRRMISLITRHVVCFQPSSAVTPCNFNYRHLLCRVTSVMFILLRRVVSVVRDLHLGRVQRGLYLHLLRSGGRYLFLRLRQTRAVHWPHTLLCAW